MANTYRIQVITEEVVPETGQVYRDAQYFSVPENKSIADFKAEKEAEIDAEKQRRIDAYVEAIKNPPKPVEPTKEELEKEQVALTEQIASLEARKVEVMSQIAVAGLAEPIVEEKP